jgi:two-component system nitrogen regulation sensor histidine kinase NtrY
MNSASPSALERLPRWLAVMARRRGWLPYVELGAFLSLIVIGIISYLILTGGQPGQRLLTPPLVAILLVANLIPAIALIVLAGRRIAMRRAANSPIGGHGRLHVRLVALFSLIASIPVLLLVIFASFLFQYGVEFWYSDRARDMFENANTLAQTFYNEKQERIVRETELMASDLSFNLSVAPIDSKGFNENFAYQVYVRELSEAAIVRFTKKNGSQSLALVNPYDRPTENWVPPAIVQQLRATRKTVFQDSGGRMQAIAPLPGAPDVYVYAARVSSPQAQAQAKRFSLVLKNYDDLVERSRTLQLQFHAALLLITLVIVSTAVWVALQVADRLVKPVGELVNAAQRVTAGDLTARVEEPPTRDELGVLSSAFNRMTGRLEAQRNEIIAASDLIDRRRAFIEAVLSGVTAGVIAVGEDRRVRVMNRSAAELLEAGPDSSAPLAQLAPELGAMLDRGESEAIVHLAGKEEARTLAVKITRDELGHVLTFDDITAQLTDQRRAAWADVARRIAHEIKNPLTPIQLAAERLKRRFAKEIHTDPATFERLTDTIVRQVGDLRRMVDEFSSFARMPKPVFHDEALIDICRQAVFLHEIAHPAIIFSIDSPDPKLRLVCDRRQLGQALTNLVKNSVEAVEAKDGADGIICVSVRKNPDSTVTLTVSDNGIGLPKERDRLAEPYMTTRERGTGLGLAIVKKIVEEHGGTLSFSDRDGGGTVITLHFDPAGTNAGDDGDEAVPLGDAGAALPSALTRNGDR